MCTSSVSLSVIPVYLLKSVDTFNEKLRKKKLQPFKEGKEQKEESTAPYSCSAAAPLCTASLQAAPLPVSGRGTSGHSYIPAAALAAASLHLDSSSPTTAATRGLSPGPRLPGLHTTVSPASYLTPVLSLSRSCILSISLYSVLTAIHIRASPHLSRGAVSDLNFTSPPK